MKNNKQYIIEQYPKNKDIENLSDEQKYLRANQKIFIYQDRKVCNKCNKEMPINEFYIVDKKTQRRKNGCRDCQIKQSGVLEVGKLRYSKKIFNKGFRRCSVCKKTKPLDKYSKCISSFGGYSNNCYQCQNELCKDYLVNQRGKIGLFYIKQYGLRKGISEFSDEIINELREEIENKRKSKYFIDGLEFSKLSDFALYIKEKYGFPITMTEKRISIGKTEEECKLTENEMRSKAYTKGSIKVLDTITGKEFEFVNSKDSELKKMFSVSAIHRCLNTGKPTKITKLSKYKNPCIIFRVLNN